MFDSHVHTDFSPDSKSTLDDYAKVVDRGIVEGIGFTDHVDFMPECGAYGYFNYEAYRSSIENIKEKGYKFYAGAEIDYNLKVENDILKHLKTHKYDYTICSVHMVDGLAVSNTKNIGRFGDEAFLMDIIDKYYSEMEASLKVPEFDVIGHIDIYRRCTVNELKVLKISKVIKDMSEAFASICALSGKLIEVNTSGMFSKVQSSFPDLDFLKIYYAYGGRNICLGSDAHNINNVAQGFDDIVRILESMGFKYLFLPWDKENPIKID